MHLFNHLKQRIYLKYRETYGLTGSCLANGTVWLRGSSAEPTRTFGNIRWNENTIVPIVPIVHVLQTGTEPLGQWFDTLLKLLVKWKEQT